MFRLDRTFVFDVGPDALWEVLARPGDFPKWWTWLKTLDTDELAEGITAHCLIRAPIPWSLRLTVRLDKVVPGQRVDAYATGDLVGRAHLEVTPHPEGSQLRLQWELEPHERTLGALGRVARPVLQWGQDWVVSNGVRQFRRRALP
jgi:uncharacterized protein YndB with AHSA1/START domain